MNVRLRFAQDAVPALMRSVLSCPHVGPGSSSSGAVQEARDPNTFYDATTSMGIKTAFCDIGASFFLGSGAMIQISFQYFPGYYSPRPFQGVSHGGQHRPAA